MGLTSKVMVAQVRAELNAILKCATSGVSGGLPDEQIQGNLMAEHGLARGDAAGWVELARKLGGVMPDPFPPEQRSRPVRS